MRFCLRSIWLPAVVVLFCSILFAESLVQALAYDRGIRVTAPKAASATHIQPTDSKTISVRHDEDLQAALDAAVAGDVIILEAGAAFTGNFLLRNKERSNWITIRSSAEDTDLPLLDTRVNLSHVNLLPKIISPNSEPALRTEAGAHHYRLIGLEFTIAPDVMSNSGIIRLGEGNEEDVGMLPHDVIIDRCYVHGQAMADVTRGIALNSARTEIINSRISDIHGLGFDTQAIGGWNGSGPYTIINNYLEAAGENVMIGGADPKIPDLVPTDIEFRRNHCAKPLSWRDGILSRPEGLLALGSSASGSLIANTTYYYRVSARARAGYSTVATSAASQEIAVTLGPDQTSANIVWNPTDRATEYNVYRTSDEPASTARRWASNKTTLPDFTDSGEAASLDSAPPESATRWSVKNLFELKSARRVVIDGNLFENNWVESQTGFAILFTVRNQGGGAAWSVIEDVSFTNNVVRHSAAGVNLLGRDNNHPSEQLKRVEISNNLFDDVGGSQWGGSGRFLQITETVDVKVDHNTVFQTGNIITAYGVPNQGFTFTNNIAPHNEFGIIGDGSSVGKLTLEHYFPAHSLKKNVIVGGRSDRYPKKNFHPASLDEVGFIDPAAGNYRLAENSPYKQAGTKQRDVGADFGRLERTAARAISGTPE